MSKTAWGRAQVENVAEKGTLRTLGRNLVGARGVWRSVRLRRRCIYPVGLWKLGTEHCA